MISAFFRSSNWNLVPFPVSIGIQGYNEMPSFSNFFDLKLVCFILFLIDITSLLKYVLVSNIFLNISVSLPALKIVHLNLLTFMRVLI